MYSVVISTYSALPSKIGIGHCAIQCAHDSEWRGLRKWYTTECGGTQCVRGKQHRQNPNYAILMIVYDICGNAFTKMHLCPNDFMAGLPRFYYFRL